MRATMTGLLAIGLSFLASSALAWSSYGNGRFGYVIDVPTGFSAVQEADNGDGGVSTSADQKSLLTIWGSNLIDGGLSDAVKLRLEDLRADGWDLSYTRETPEWAGWSGTRQGRILYGRVITLCDDQAAYFQIDYPQAEVEPYKPVVERLVKSFQNGQKC